MTHPAPSQQLQIGLDGFGYADLFKPTELARLHAVFGDWLKRQDATLYAAWQQGLTQAHTINDAAYSELALALAPKVGAFIAKLFSIEAQVDAVAQTVRAEEPVFVFKKEFVKKRVFAAKAGEGWPGSVDAAREVSEVAWQVAAEHIEGCADRRADEELYVAQATLWLHDIDETARKAAKAGGASWTSELHARVTHLRQALASAELLGLFGAQAAHDDDDALVAQVCLAIEKTLVERRKDAEDAARGWVSLHQPHKWNFDALVPLRRSADDQAYGAYEGDEHHRRERVEPFALTDARGSARQVAAEVDYCLYCHDREKDSCSKGLKDKQGAIKKNPLGVEVKGCPLHEKISEMHLLRRSGEVIGSLATAMIDNPMVAGTGHRICNDCMKGCVYQTQEPVNIPQVETRLLTDVLELPWGVEVYSLLTRFNPLNLKRPYALPYNGKNVMVVGLGPAGYTLAHYLLGEGFGVLGIDGLKLEPLSARWVGDAEHTPEPVHDVGQLFEPLESRRTLGFGGVSEYGITVRWDKNFLGLIYLNLARRHTFEAIGGVRFGGTLTLDDAFGLGVHHVAIATGAGSPTIINLKNNMMRGIRKASDFLMALQLTGAYKRDTLANLQVRLPAVVIGSGLTAIDTATELLAYYVVEAERAYHQYKVLSVEVGEAALRQRFDDEELGIIDELRAHGAALINERALAAAEQRTPRIQELVQGWGGVSIVYRRRLQESPAYRLNHEEIEKSLEEGVRYHELLAPVQAHADQYGAVEALSFERQAMVDGKLRGTGEMVRMPARSVCIAAGTKPNIMYEKEHPGTFELDERGYFANHRLATQGAKVVGVARTDDKAGFFTSYWKNDHAVSYFGDNHPRYAGSVVKAMASAKDGYTSIVALFQDALGSLKAQDQMVRDDAWQVWRGQMREALSATVHSVQYLAPQIVEIVVKAPMAARKFEPGQFYRLQNLESEARHVDGTPLVMEGLAMTGAWTEPKQGLLSMIALEMGTSSKLCAQLKVGEQVVVMGPTGAPTEIGECKAVLLAGGGLGNAVLFSIARAFKAHGAQVIYFAGYRDSATVFKMDEIEASTDQVVWASDTGADIVPRRAHDRYYRGNIVQAMVAYAKGDLGEVKVKLSDVGRIIAIGSDRMMQAVKDARHGVLAEYLDPKHIAIGSINSPMQCMMKEICAQCLQRHIDPVTGEERLVYSCFNQDQPLDVVDFAHLSARLRQNSAQEKLSDAWLTHLRFSQR